MLNAYERQLILFYLSNAASRFHRAFPERRKIWPNGSPRTATSSRSVTRTRSRESTGRADTTKRKYPHGNGSSCGRP